MQVLDPITAHFEEDCDLEYRNERYRKM